MSGPSKAICSSLKGLSRAAGGQARRAAAAALKGCSSEALYFGIGTSPDPVRARQCAYLERTSRADTGGFSGNTMLMIIYANGVGAEPNLDLATTLACQLDGAPAEGDGRLGLKPIIISDINLATGRLPPNKSDWLRSRLRKRGALTIYLINYSESAVHSNCKNI